MMTHHAKEQIIEAVSRITKEDLAMISEEQRKIMYNGLATKGRLAADPEECAKIDKQLETDPKNYYLWCARAIVCGDIEQAIENYSQALSIRPFSPHTLYNRGRKLMGQGRFSQALSDFALATALDQEDGWKWHFQGVALYFLDRYEDAVESFQRAIQAHNHINDPVVPFEVEWMWNCYMKLGRGEEAAGCLEQVTAETPCVDSEKTYKTHILMYKGDMTVEEFLNTIDPEDVLETANQLYGVANFYYYLKGDTRTSVEYLHKVIALTEAKLCWGYKMALRDLPGRAEETCAESHS